MSKFMSIGLTLTLLVGRWEGVMVLLCRWEGVMVLVCRTLCRWEDVMVVVGSGTVLVCRWMGGRCLCVDGRVQ